MRVRNLVAVFTALESIFLLTLAIYLIARTLYSDIEELDAVVAEIIFLIAGAAGLFFAGRGVRNGKRYGRGPVVMANLIALGVAYYMIEGDRLLWGISLGAIAITTSSLAIAAIPRQVGGKGFTSL